MMRHYIVRGLSALICVCTLVSISAFPPRKFVSIFNGSTLDGWTSKQKGGWKAKDGILHFDGSSDMADANLWTTKKYCDYVLTFDYRVAGKHDDARDIGVMLRENAAFTFEQHLPNNLWNRAVITVRFNPAEIEVRGISPNPLNAITVEVELNGKPFSQTTFSGVPEEGPIALQPRRLPIEFANVQIKELPAKSSPEAFIPPDGFIPLFNGRNLDGWKTSLEVEKHWIPRNGFLKNSTTLPSEDSATLWTEKSYGSYTLLFDWRPVGKDRPHDLISVFVYNNRLDLKGDPDGGWNRAEIIVQSGIASWSVNRLSGWRKTVAASTRSFFIGGHGAIGFEDPSFPVQFANIYIKELPAETPKAEDSLPPEGFVSLFNGRNLDGWEVASLGAAWKVNDSILENHSGHSAIISTNKYRNYILIFDWRVPKDDPHSNAPYLYVDRGPRPTGVRERFRNAFFFPEATLPPNLVGKWNRSRLIVQEDRCTIQVNDREVATSDKLAGGTQPGKFGIGRDGARFDLANIYIKELK